MAKLESDTRAARQVRQEILEPRQIAAEKRRQLEQDRAAFAALVQGARGREKARGPLLCIFEPLDVRDVLMRLYGKFEIRGRGSDPARQQFFGGETAKCVVQLHRIQSAAVVAEEFGRGEFRGIKLRLPLRVGPAGCACIQLSHVFLGPLAVSPAARSGFAGARRNYRFAVSS